MKFNGFAVASLIVLPMVLAACSGASSNAPKVAGTPAPSSANNGFTNAQSADPDVTRALRAREDLLQTPQIKELMAKRVVAGVAVDLSMPVASLDVTAEPGAVEGESHASYARRVLSDSFEGVPVRVTSLETIDATKDVRVLPMPSP
jgi:hypothetical protein